MTQVAFDLRYAILCVATYFPDLGALTTIGLTVPIWETILLTSSVARYIAELPHLQGGYIPELKFMGFISDHQRRLTHLVLDSEKW